ncbi:MAG: transglycosylase domain-containing protein [Micrococcales bacterium]|nr:transglycosylase domain-containing protein [Micrococcales bacterium]
MSKGSLAAFAAKKTGKWVIGLAAFTALSVAAGVLASGFILPGVAIVNASAKGAIDIFDALPDQLGEEIIAQRSYIYWSDGSLMATYFDENRQVVPLNQISQHMQNAVIALEDKRFWEHGGIDPPGMLRAFLNNMSGKAVQGASTLTQQYVKNVLVERAAYADDAEAARQATEESISRKLREAKTAMTVEKKIGKERVLEGYLNISPFGARVYGAQAAAKYYFGVDAADLTPVQAATIAATAQNPMNLDPTRNPEKNQSRRDTALKVMMDEGYLTKAQYDEAVAQAVEDTLDVHPITVGCEEANKKAAGFFCDYVVLVIRNSPEFGKTPAERINLLRRGGLRVSTTLKKKTQKMAYDAVVNTIPVNDSSGVAIALSAVEPKTGKILAMAQNRDYVAVTATKKNKRATAVNYNTDQQFGGSTGFQAGSTFKPFILAEYLNEGFSLGQKFPGLKHDWGNSVWRAKGCLPEDDDAYHLTSKWDVPNVTKGNATTDAIAATANSVNTAYVYMESKVDLCSATKQLEKMGIHRADGQPWFVRPSMVLGTNEVAPLTMAAGYATFAAGGIYCKPIAITKVTDADGKELPVPEANCKRAMKADVAWGVAKAMQAVMTHGTGTLVALKGGRPHAGKTGTTDEQVAVWFGGFTPQVATAVWAGFSEASKKLQNISINGEFYTKATGGRLPGKAWRFFMEDYLEGKKAIPFPEPNEKITRGEEITVPKVVGLDLPAARLKAEEEGFLVAEGPNDWCDDQPAGRICTQRPEAGQKLRLSEASTITVFLSKGPEPPENKDDNPLIEPTKKPGKGGSGKKPGKKSTPTPKEDTSRPR